MVELVSLTDHAKNSFWWLNKYDKKKNAAQWSDQETGERPESRVRSGLTSEARDYNAEVIRTLRTIITLFTCLTHGI